jgi:hypothetical protein
MDNAKEYPEAWKIFIDCARKWESDDKNKKNKWVYGIPNPDSKNLYIYSDCPGELFKKFREIFYKSPEDKIKEFRDFLNWLEFQEGKRGYESYRSMKSNMT